MSQNPEKKAHIEELVSVAKRGDSEAFGKIYDLLIDQIYRYMYYRVSKEEAEDLTELVFLKAWENLHQYTPGRAQFSSWIFRIAHNLVVDFYREQNGNFQENLDDHIVDTRPEAYTPLRAHCSLDKDILHSAMAELKDNYRQVLILKYINGLSNEEIALILNKSQAALRILQFRALKHLKKILENRGITSF